MSGFHARDVSISDVEDTLSVVFADDAAEPRDYLLLQRLSHPTPQDIQLGQDGPYVERNSQMWGAYGGIVGVRLETAAVALEFDAETAKKLGLGEESSFKVGLSPGSWEPARLRSALARLFDGIDVGA